MVPMIDLFLAARIDIISIFGGLLIGFAVGSIPSGYLLVRLKTGEDVRQTGSGNIGATNVSRALGVGGGVITLFLDAAKGAAKVACDKVPKVLKEDIGEAMEQGPGLITYNRS